MKTIQKSRKQPVFSGLISYRMDGTLNQTRVSLHPSSIQTVTVGPGVSPGHAFWNPAACSYFQEQTPKCHIARGLYHRSGITPCPEGFYLIVEIIPYRARCISVRFDDAIDRADADALGGIMVTLAFDAGSLINDVGDAIAFADRFGRAFGYARATGDAIFSNFHCHGSILLQYIGTADTKLLHAVCCVN